MIDHRIRYLRQQIDDIVFELKKEHQYQKKTSDILPILIVVLSFVSVIFIGFNIDELLSVLMLSLSLITSSLVVILSVMLVSLKKRFLLVAEVLVQLMEIRVEIERMTFEEEVHSIAEYRRLFRLIEKVLQKIKVPIEPIKD